MKLHTDTWGDLTNAFNGPIPPAEIAAARWGRGAFARVSRAAASAGAEAQVRAVLAMLRRAAKRDGFGGVLHRLERLVADGRQRALAVLADG